MADNAELDRYYRKEEKMVRMQCTIYFLIGCLAVLSTSASLAISSVPGFTAVIDAVAYDPAAQNTYDTARIWSFPESDSLNANSGGVSNTTEFSLSSSSFDVTFSHARNSNFVSNARTIVQVPFLADSNVDYLLTGEFFANDPDGRYIRLRSYLHDDSAFRYVFVTATSSQSTPNENLTFGRPNGESNSVTGSLTGTLIAGHQYVFFLEATFSNYPTAGSPASATGHVTLSFIPEPNAALLIGIGMGGFAVMKQKDNAAHPPS